MYPLGYMGSLTTGSPIGHSFSGVSGSMYSLATVRVHCGGSELCSIGTGVTEKVTKTFHFFLGSSSPFWSPGTFGGTLGWFSLRIGWWSS